MAINEQASRDATSKACPSFLGKPGRMARLVAHRATAAAAAHSRCSGITPTRSATTFLKPFTLNKFKLHPVLDVRQRSRLITEEGGENASCGH